MIYFQYTGYGEKCKYLKMPSFVFACPIRKKGLRPLLRAPESVPYRLWRYLFRLPESLGRMA